MQNVWEFDDSSAVRLKDQENHDTPSEVIGNGSPRPVERRFRHQISTAEKPLHPYRMSGLTGEQLDELMTLVEELLEEHWDKPTGRPKCLCLRDALIVACGYMRNNISEEIWAEIFDVDQSSISRYITSPDPTHRQGSGG